MTEGDDLRMTRAAFEKAVRKVLSAPPHSSSKKSKRKKAKQKRKAKG
jgi:hypothetical protein